MTQTEISNYLTTGCLYRKPSGEILTFHGPITENLSKNSDFSVAKQDFFSESLQFYSAKCQKTHKSIEQMLGPSLKIALKLSISRKDFKKFDANNFKHSFEKIQYSIENEGLKKAVPIVSLRASIVPSHDDQLYWISNLLSLPSELNVFGFWDQNGGIIGATPEILFYKKKDVISSMALAGTSEKKTAQHIFLQNKKELHEHNLVVEDIENQLAKLGKPICGLTHVLELPKLNHLKTDLQVTNSQTSIEFLVKLLHPTPALGVAPRTFGYQWLSDLPEQSDRKLFGAPIVFKLAQDEYCALVAIRAIQWDQHGTTISAGCGIVRESQIENEENEIEAKLNSVFDSLGM